MISNEEFLRLAADGHNRIPVSRELLADLETPLSLYLKLCQGRPMSFLLESVIGGERFGRYSFIGLPARTLLRATGRTCELVSTQSDDSGRFVCRRQGKSRHCQSKRCRRID